MKRSTIYVAALGLFGLVGAPALAATDCTFTVSGTTMALDADCTTDETICVMDGYTLDGKNNAITAVDPSEGFVGGVVENEGAVAHVTRLVINTSSLANVCKGGASRLRGILFEDTSGTITYNTVTDINKGASGCQEGNAIEVRNAPFDGSHPGTQAVEIAHNVIQDWQKTGIVCNGDVICDIHHNMVGESFTQENLAANGVQMGFGATGLIEHNHIAGNQWLGVSNYAASAVLTYCADGALVWKNNIGGNADIGIFVIGCGANGVVVDNNRVFEKGADGPHGDFGLVEYGSGNMFTNNKVRGFDIPVFSDDGEITGTKIIPKPQY